MAQKFYRTPDGQSGLFFTGFGALVTWQSLQYPIGKASQMGPGFFPMVLGGLLTAVGLIVVVKSLAAGQDAAMPFEWRSAVVITASILASALLLLTAGLLIAIPVLVVGSSFASRDLRWAAVLTATVALTLMAYLIFILGLGLQIPLYWN